MARAVGLAIASRNAATRPEWERRRFIGMKNALLFLPVALGLGLAGCDEVGFISGSVTTSRTGYYGNDSDFYFVDRTPYSRSYGPLVYRNDRYYYRRGRSLVTYDRPVRRWRDSDRHVREYRNYDRRDRDRRNYDDDDDEDRRDDRRGDWRDRRY